MDFEILEDGSYPALEVSLDPGETLVSEAGAMAWMDPCIQVKTRSRGGVLSGLKRSMLGGESFFQNEYSSLQKGGKVAFVSGQPGCLVPLDLKGNTVMLEKGAFLVSTPGVTLDSKFQGLKGLFNEGMFVLQASGQGRMYFGSYGEISEIQVQGEYVVDNGYAVAWDSTLNYTITRSKKIRSFLFSDQLLLRFSGHGRIWVQSRSPRALSSWIYPYRRVKSRN